MPNDSFQTVICSTSHSPKLFPSGSDLRKLVLHVFYLSTTSTLAEGLSCVQEVRNFSKSLTQ